MSAIQDNLEAVRGSIERAALAAGRSPDTISLLAVSKTFGADAVREAALCGQRAFGENYLQKALDKMALLSPDFPGLRWHYIGAIQRNKTRPIAEHFDWVHTVDSLIVAQRLSHQRPEALASLQVCIQVNISGEDSKHGIDPAETLALAREIARLPRLRLRGLMAIPAPSADPDQQRKPLGALRELLATLQADGLAVDTLSMGMSADLEAAIAEGSTLVRVGSAIFGKREASK